MKSHTFALKHIHSFISINILTIHSSGKQMIQIVWLYWLCISLHVYSSYAHFISILFVFCVFRMIVSISFVLCVGLLFPIFGIISIFIFLHFMAAPFYSSRLFCFFSLNWPNYSDCPECWLNPTAAAAGRVERYAFHIIHYFMANFQLKIVRIWIGLFVIKVALFGSILAVMRKNAPRIFDCEILGGKKRICTNWIVCEIVLIFIFHVICTEPLLVLAPQAQNVELVLQTHKLNAKRLVLFTNVKKGQCL